MLLEMLAIYVTLRRIQSLHIHIHIFSESLEIRNPLRYITICSHTQCYAVLQNSNITFSVASDQMENRFHNVIYDCKFF